MGRGSVIGLPSSREARRLVLALVATQLLLWTGGSAILPLLPTYLSHEGASPGLIGLVMASYFAAAVLTQYPIGRLSDRYGRPPVVAAGLVLFALGSLGFALSSGAAAAVAFRALEGVGAGAVTVAAAATVGAHVALAERGRAFGALYGSQMLALAVGPLIGSVIGESSMRALFLAAAASALVALAPVLAVLPPSPSAPAPVSGGVVEALATAELGGGRSGGRPNLPLTPVLFGALVAFGATGLLTGVYESCWTLLLRLRGASAFDVGLSWTLFALPFAALAAPAGRLAERLDRRSLTVCAVLVSAVFGVTYPFVHNVAVLVGLGGLEACGAVIGTPAAVLVLSESVPDSLQGEAQGAAETARMAATAGAAALSGALFGLWSVIPFALASALCCVAALLIAWSWRHLEAGPHRSGGRLGGAALAEDH